MKYLLGLCLFALALQVQANDKILGPVVAVEREITNVQESCLQNLKEAEELKGSFSCGVRFLKDNEFIFKRSSVLRFDNSNCQVNIDNFSGILYITFKAKNSTQLSAAKSCLQDGLDKQGAIKATLFKVQSAD